MDRTRRATCAISAGKNKRRRRSEGENKHFKLARRVERQSEGECTSRSYTCYIMLKIMREMPKTTLDWGIPSENDRGMASQRGIMKLEGCPRSTCRTI